MWGRWLLTEHPGRGQRPPGNELQAPGTRGSVPAGPSERPGQGSRWVGGRDSALVPSPCGPGQGAADEASGWVGPESAALLGHGQDRAGARRAAPREGPWCLQQHQRPWRPRRTRTRGGAGGHTQIHTHTHTHPHTHKDGHTHTQIHTCCPQKAARLTEADCKYLFSPGSLFPSFSMETLEGKGG